MSATRYHTANSFFWTAEAMLKNSSNSVSRTLDKSPVMRKVLNAALHASLTVAHNYQIEYHYKNRIFDK